MSKRNRESSTPSSGSGDDATPPSSRSSLGSSVESVHSDADDENALDDLLEFVKVSAQAVREQKQKSTETASDGPLSLLSSALKGGESGAAAAVKHLKAELLKPVSISSALTVVNMEDESAEAKGRLLASKIPKPPAEDTKKLRQLRYVDHSKVEYLPIRKSFYIVSQDVKQLTPEEVKELMKELDGAKVKGSNPPRPLRSWNSTGLPVKVLDLLEKSGYKAPFAVQSVGAPALMSGRDLLVTAKTGSGKTLSYALPLVRHCIDQPRCLSGEGPIGLVLVPTQELAVQVYNLLSALCGACGLRCVASYGSTSLADNIVAIKAGNEVMVATPGRLLDLLTVNGGNTVSLTRASFVVVDEADRLFDSGFIEHVEAFLKNCRPDRQLAMISATMPKELKQIVHHHLHDPIEISVGGRPTPASNVEQTFYFFDEEVYQIADENKKEDKRFEKLLQILGDEGEDGNRLILVFVQRKEEVDEVMAKLSGLGYQNRVATLYSGMDPIDREFALEHFAPGKQFILVATAIAERGLDIPYLELVINYVLPNHYEAYVHRIGRTGRAGKSGRAISFFTRKRDDDIAPELAEGLERAGQLVPEELYELAAKVRELRKEGRAHYNASFYRGYLKGKKMRFGDRDHKDQAKQAAKSAGLEEYLSSSSYSDTGSDAESDNGEPPIVAVSGKEAKADAMPTNALSLYKGGTVALSAQSEDRIAKALAYGQKTTDATSAENGAADIRFEVDYPINDFPDVVRIKLQRPGFLRSVEEETNTTIVKKGIFYDKRYKHSHKLQEGEKPLYLRIIGKTTDAVQGARRKLNEKKDETMNRIKKKTSVVGSL